MSFFERLSNIFFSPQRAAKAIAEKPVWVDALILIIIAAALFTYLSMPFQQKDSLEMMRNNIKMQERLGEARFNEYIANLENPSKTGTIIRSIVIAPLSLIVGFLFQCLILLGLGRVSSSQGKYMHIFSGFLHARFIDIVLGGAIKTILVLTKKSFMQTTTSLAMFFPKLEVTSSAFMILSQIDFFQLWAYGVLGLVLSHIFQVELKKGLIISYAVWLLKTLLYIALGFLSLRFMR